MPSILQILRLVLGSTALAMLLFAAVAWRRRRRAPEAVPFALLMLAAAFYAFGYAGELGQRSAGGLLLWLHVQYVGLPWIPALWLLVALQYGGQRLPRSLTVCLFTVPGVVFLAHHSNAWHGLFYRSVVAVDRGPFCIARFDRGPFYWLHFACAQASLLAGVWLYTVRLRSSGAFRRQAQAMILGSLVPMLGYVVFLAGWSPWDLDLTPFALSLAAGAFFAALYRFRLFDLSPIAREHVFEAMRDAVLVTDARGRLADLNPAARQLLPELAGAILGHPLGEALAAHPDLLEALRGGPKQVQLANGRGEERCYQVTRFPVGHGKRAGTATILADVTDHQRLLEETRQLAETDALTETGNRRRFRIQMKAERARSARYGTPFAVLMVDLDHFKHVNDTHGHAAGDAVLREAARRIQQALRDSDCLARHGGEEFTVLLEGAGREEAFRVGERIRARLAQTPILFQGQAIPIRASLGVAVHPGGPGADPEGLLAEADRALYRAKAEGRDRICG